MSEGDLVATSSLTEFYRVMLVFFFVWALFVPFMKRPPFVLVSGRATAWKFIQIYSCEHRHRKAKVFPFFLRVSDCRPSTYRRKSEIRWNETLINRKHTVESTAWNARIHQRAAMAATTSRCESDSYSSFFFVGVCLCGKFRFQNRRFLSTLTEIPIKLPHPTSQQPPLILMTSTHLLLVRIGNQRITPWKSSPSGRKTMFYSTPNKSHGKNKWLAYY